MKLAAIIGITTNLRGKANYWRGAMTTPGSVLHALDQVIAWPASVMAVCLTCFLVLYSPIFLRICWLMVGS